MSSQKKRILVVDDEPSFTRLVKLNLESTGYEVREENDGERALSVARDFKPDLILLDVIMPGADGGQVANDIAKDEELKHVPIVFLTAAVSRKEVGAEGKVIRGRAFLAKPVNIPELIRYIEKRAA